MAYERNNFKTGQVLTADALNHMEDGIAMAMKGGGVTATTYAELKALRDAGQLKAGAFYRITDYMTTTTQENTQSAGHQFDVIVLALDGSRLSEKAWAAHHEGDEYFKDSNLSAWQIWYCLDNDTERFVWADNIGKGVIYRMIDEFNNDVPYDFKNIKFLRGFDQGGLNDKSTRKDYLYTFSYVTDTVKDATIYVNAGKVLNDEGLNTGCANNTIKPWFDYEGQVNPRTPSQRLSNNIFYSSSELEPDGYTGVVNNYLGGYCTNNSFNGRIIGVYLMSYCEYNRFRNNEKIFLFLGTHRADFEDETVVIQAGTNSNGETVIKNFFDE